VPALPMDAAAPVSTVLNFDRNDFFATVTTLSRVDANACTCMHTLVANQTHSWRRLEAVPYRKPDLTSCPQVVQMPNGPGSKHRKCCHGGNFKVMSIHAGGESYNIVIACVLNIYRPSRDVLCFSFCPSPTPHRPRMIMADSATVVD
jgi:hypothetical protein